MAKAARVPAGTADRFSALNKTTQMAVGHDGQPPLRGLDLLGMLPSTDSALEGIVARSFPLCRIRAGLLSLIPAGFRLTNRTLPETMFASNIAVLLRDFKVIRTGRTNLDR